MCKNKYIEDERHFVMSCPLYDDLQETLCQHYYEQIDGSNDRSADKRVNLIMKTACEDYPVKQVLICILGVVHDMYFIFLFFGFLIFIMDSSRFTIKPAHPFSNI